MHVFFAVVLWTSLRKVIGQSYQCACIWIYVLHGLHARNLIFVLMRLGMVPGRPEAKSGRCMVRCIRFRMRLVLKDHLQQV